MAQAVKFYSVASLPTSNIDQNGLYFVGSGTTGELYKGSTRFSTGKVFLYEGDDNLPKSGMVQGDVAIDTATNVAAIFDGSTWTTIGVNVSALQASWIADITSSINALDKALVGSSTDTASEITSIITGISETDGVIDAHAVAFPSIATGDADGQVKFNGTNAKVSGWDDLVGRVDTAESDIDALESAIADMDLTLVGSDTGLTSIITGVSQEDGKVSAYAVAFPELTSPSEGHVSLNGTDVEVSGWTSLSSRVTDLETWQTSVTGSTVVSGTKLTAETGTFTNLSVAGVAEFNVTSVIASSLSVGSESAATFGGSTISQIADRQIAAIASVTKSATDDGVTVSVTTSAGSVQSVEVTVDATVNGSFTSELTSLARAMDVVEYVDNAVADLAGAMHFVGTVSGVPTGTNNGSSLPSGEQNKAGDIVINTTTAKEYVFDGTNWHELGNEDLVGKLSEYAGYDTTLTTSAQTLAGGVNELDAAIKAMDYSVAATADNGVKVQITQVDGAITSVVTTVDAVETSAGVVTGSTSVVTAGAVADYVGGLVSGLDSTVTSSANGVEISVTEEDGVLTAASVALTKADLNAFLGTTSVADKSVVTVLSLSDASNNNLPTESAVVDAINDAVTTAQEYIDSEIEGLDSTVSASSKGVEVTVEETDGKLTSASLTVTAPSTMAFNDAGSSDELATTAAVKSFFDNNLVWLDASGAALA